MRLTGVEYARALAGRTASRLFAAHPMVLRSDKIEIENSGPDVSESEEAVEMDGFRPFVRNFLN
jgi:hypothetical protein